MQPSHSHDAAAAAWAGLRLAPGTCGGVVWPSLLRPG